MHLKDWKTRPSGGAITVTGTDVDTGEKVRISGVVELHPHIITHSRFFGLVQITDAYVVAVTRTGKHSLQF